MIIVSILAVLYLLRLWPGAIPIAGDLVLGIPIPPPQQFWIVLILFVAQVIVAYLYMRERGRLRRALSGRHERLPVAEPEPELRPHGPVPEEEVEYVEVAEEESADPVDYVPDRRPMPAPAAAEGRRDGEFSKLLDWLDDVSAQISGWAGGVMGSVDHAVHPKKTPPPTPLVLADHEPQGTTKTAVPKLGAWSEIRARAAIEKYLRKRPWAPATDIARELGMDVRLATRVTASVREESVR